MKVTKEDLPRGDLKNDLEEGANHEVGGDKHSKQRNKQGQWP